MTAIFKSPFRTTRPTGVLETISSLNRFRRRILSYSRELLMAMAAWVAKSSKDRDRSQETGALH